MEQDVMIDILSAGRKFDFHPNTIRIWCKKNLLPYKVGKRSKIYFWESDLKKVMDNKNWNIL